jgi:dTDP-4-dehydrorhamnose 3,5-epimerase-like enzyme
MEFRELDLAGVFEIKNYTARDKRGVFLKTFHENAFSSIGFNDRFTACYYSKSKCH